MQQTSYNGILREPPTIGDRVYVSSMVLASYTPQMRIAEAIVDYVARHPTKANFTAWHAADVAREYLRANKLDDPEAGAIRKHVLYTVSDDEYRDYGEIYNDIRWWVGKTWPEKREHLLRVMASNHSLIEIAAVLNITRRICASWLKKALAEDLIYKQCERRSPPLYHYYLKEQL